MIDGHASRRRRTQPPAVSNDESKHATDHTVPGWERQDPVGDQADCHGYTRGSEGSRLREYKLPPLLYVPVESPVTLRRPAQHQPQIDPILWPEIAERA